MEKIKTLNGENTFQSYAVDGLKLCNSGAKSKKTWPILSTTCTQNQLSVDKDEVAVPNKLKPLKYLEPILDERDYIQMDLLIGANCVKALEPIKAISSKAQGLYAYKTVLRCCVVRPIGVNKTKFKEMKCNKSLAKRAYHHFVFKSSIRETDKATVTKDV